MRENLTRRWFIGGAASFAGLGLAPVRLFAGQATGRLIARFGVVSDIHFGAVGKADQGLRKNANDETFVKAMEWFRDQGADGVIIAGDMAHRGMTYELKAVADAWFRVFPDDKAPDGRKVERLFVTGNHEWEGAGYGDFAKKIYPDEAERAQYVLRHKLEKTWAELFHEDYKPICLKTVKGIPFVGAHWHPTEPRGHSGPEFPGLAEFLSANRGKFDPKLPLLYAQHPHPKDTCYGPWAWGHDNGFSTKALSAYSNAIAFSGHSHYSIVDERSIWQGAFVSVGTASLRYSGVTFDSFPSGSRAFENSASVLPNSKRKVIDGGKMMREIPSQDGRQGMLVSVYEDCVVFARRNFADGFEGSLGSDWVLPLPNAEAKPFAHLKRTRDEVAPQFVAGDAIRVARGKAKNRKGEKKDAFTLTFPNAAAPNRAFSYAVDARTADGKLIMHKDVLACDFNVPLGKRTTSTCVFAVDELGGAEKAVFAVTPIASFGAKGRELTVEQKIS